MKSQRQLLKVRNLGRNSLNEIKDKLAEYDYYYMDLDSNAQKAHPEEGSVVDICEQVAETLGIQSPSEVIGGMNEEKPEMKPIVTVDEYDALYTKYNDIQIGLSELSKRYEILLKEKTDLEKERDDIHAKYNMLLELKNNVKLEEFDIINLVKAIICRMNTDKMDWLYLTLDGMTVDIHKKADVEGSPRMSYTIRTREE